FSVETFPFFVPSTTVRHENTSWAVFGQVSYDLTDRATLTAGVRYTDDDKDMSTPRGFNLIAPVSVSHEQVSWDLSLSFARTHDAAGRRAFHRRRQGQAYPARLQPDRAGIGIGRTGELGPGPFVRDDRRRESLRPCRKRLPRTIGPGPQHRVPRREPVLDCGLR